MDSNQTSNAPVTDVVANQNFNALTTIVSNTEPSATLAQPQVKISRNSPSNLKDNGDEVIAATVRYQDVFSSPASPTAGTLLKNYKFSPSALATAHEKIKPLLNEHEFWRLRYVNFSFVNAEKFNTAGGALKLCTSSDAANTIPGSAADVLKWAATNPKTKHISVRSDGVDAGFTQNFEPSFKYTNDKATRDINLSTYPDVNVILSTSGSDPQFTFEVNVTMLFEFKSPLYKSDRITAFKPMNFKNHKCRFLLRS